MEWILGLFALLAMLGLFKKGLGVTPSGRTVGSTPPQNRAGFGFWSAGLFDPLLVNLNPLSPLYNAPVVHETPKQKEGSTTT